MRFAFLSCQTALALAAAGLLAACEPKPPEPKTSLVAPALTAPAMAGTMHAAPAALTTADVSATAAVVINPHRNALRVWLLNAGQSQEFIDPPTAKIPWPRDVQTLIKNQRRAVP